MVRDAGAGARGQVGNGSVVEMTGRVQTAIHHTLVSSHTAPSWWSVTQRPVQVRSRKQRCARLT